ncbi:LLM class flavin-dependent oxidoreductase [Thalassococcus sp. S3]|uniref:LLM class flavin-dependent oxidoreductase n=1 Tax=Thalassococcus sp. S3 TaxID=2017482 RepID=UPI00102411DC|nr:LLM class flavin-dependent oxidoreductase [Thalassococcus sp. S3]QBF29677.1 alkanesulfonate monooxygenase [Thalassococcus sp. S3]
MKLLTTAPPSVRFAPKTYLDAVTDLARWNEAAGVEGMLMYTDNSLMDPWCVAQAVMEGTERFVPLVAVQPIYMSPLAAARKVSSLAFLYGRKMALNMVAGGFKKDLEQLGDATEHDARYDRLVEYTQILQALLRGGPVTFSGAYYQVSNLKLSPALPPELMPDIYLSGASDACLAAAATLEATRFSYTKPPADLEPKAPLPGAGRLGLRFGVIARPDAEEAWAIARDRFPADRRGQMAHKMARGVTDSVWHHEISELADDLHDARDGAYWLYPIKNYRTFCPYLVGSYDEVADYIRRYAALGFRCLILDVPQSQDDLAHAMTAYHRSSVQTQPVVQPA